MAEFADGGEKPDNGSGSGSEASNGFEVLDDLTNDEPVVDSTTGCDCCVMQWWENLRNNKEVMNILYWRNPAKSGVVFAFGLLLLFSLHCFSFISVVGYSGISAILAMVGMKYYCRFTKSNAFNALFEHRCTLQREDVDMCVQRCVQHWNAAMQKVDRVLRFEDLYLTLKVVIGLFLLTEVGDWFDLLTLVIIGYVLTFALPPIYERQHDQIDAVLGNCFKIAKEKFEQVQGEVKKKLTKKQA